MAKIQLVVEIEERLYKNIIDNDKDDEEFEAMDDAFNNAKPLPKDATNGNIFKAMFSNLTIYENRDNKDYPYVDVIIGEHDSTCYPKDWWNAPYKRGEEDADSN